MIFSGASLGGHGNGWLTMVDILVPPVVATATLLGFVWASGVHFDDRYAVLAVIAFMLTLFVYRELAAVSGTIARRPRDFLQRSIGAWAIVAGCLAVLMFAFQAGEDYSRRILLTWGIVTPLLVAALQYWAHVAIENSSSRHMAVIAGVSDLSRRLARNIDEHPTLGLQVAGWFEDRGAERIGAIDEGKLLGKLSDLPEYVKKHSVDVIYIALPIRHEERTRRLLDELHDTTASIYFVPDIFVFDLIQSRVDSLNGIPVLALCETPFVGVNGLMKRVSDVVLAATMLVVFSPVLLAVAVGVAVTTPGAVLFKQRRYGLDGREIVVYKFRSMVSSDDGTEMRQASRDDPRITPFGKIIRKYSLDELPQLINVVQGRMSLVGPRPHAVAHNEEYRRLIKGYMIRHKVAPGITGLAQVRGHRGETTTVEEMRARVESDLEYLRRWSLALDIKILWLTAVRVFNDTKAY
jgi:putative colanic acid biosynthesis UDP-glucose lipid carrier transferase